MYKVIKRNWWIDNPDYPNGLEPGPGPSTYIRTFESEAEAREFCKNWNATHDPGKHSLKAEYVVCR